MQRSTLILTIVTTGSAALIAAGCGSSAAIQPATTAATTPAATSVTTPGGVIAVAPTALGQVLVDGQGRTVYLLTADTSNHSSCNAQCLGLWPAVAAPSGASLPHIPGISATLAVTKASNGTSMLTVGGWPVYTFVKDKAPGDVTGQGKKSFGGTWYVVSAAGAPVTTAPSGEATSTGSATPSTTGETSKDNSGY